MATLPDPFGPLWLFDGVCNLCSGSVQAVLAIDRRGLIRLTPIQSGPAGALRAGATAVLIGPT